MFKRGRLTPFVAALALTVAACGEDNPVDTGDAPAQPVVQSVTETGSALVVTWAAVTGATAYDVQRQEAAGGTFATIASDETGTTYSDASAVAGTGYNYRVIAKNSDGDSTPSDPVYGEIGVAATTEVLSGTITDDRMLDASLTYIVTGIVVVDDGASLTIPAGTELQGSVTVQPSAIIVRTGGQIFSNGTETDPVVMTSAAPVGQRARGDWGGLVINGLSQCNFPADDCVGEGASGPYGGTTLDDDSGVVTYTRIEFAGFEVSFGNELNALTLNGVGSETELSYIQTHYGSDDGFEFFGGTVNLKYALATGISDDSFDYSTGWAGYGQFWLAQQDPDDADNGFEVDGNEEDFDAMPLTDPMIYNVTLVGKGLDGAGGTDGESVDGFRLRRGTGGDIFNAIVIGFGGAGVDVDNAETVGRYTVQNSIIARNGIDISDDADGFQDDVENTVAWANLIGTDPLLVSPFDRDAPDFRPGAGSAALASAGNGATPPADAAGFFDVTATFIGAVDPDATTQWFEGWTTFARN